MNADEFNPIDWARLEAFIREIMTDLPPGAEPDICGYGYDEKHKELAQYQEISDSVSSEVDEVLRRFVGNGCTWPRSKRIVYFYVQRRLEFARDVARLFQAMQDTCVSVYLRNDRTRIGDIALAVAVDFWISIDGEFWSAFRERYVAPDGWKPLI